MPTIYISYRCVSYCVVEDELIKVSVRHILQDNTVVTWLHNHRIQLYNVLVAQLV